MNSTLTKESVLVQKLAEIQKVLIAHVHEVDEIGVLSGSAGIALFQFYYAKLTGEESYADQGVEILASIIEKINTGYNFHTFCSGIAGAAWTIQLLQEEGYVDLDCDELLSDLDSFLIQSIAHITPDDNFYDFLHGILGIGYYFLKRFEHTQNIALQHTYRQILADIVALLQERGQHDNSFTRWESYVIRQEGVRGYNLGLSHGIPSIINFLSRLAVHQEFKSEVLTLIHQSVAFILSCKNEDTLRSWIFPSWVTTSQQKSESSRLGWCYGDLGVAISLWKAGKLLDHEPYKQEAIATLLHTTRRKKLEEAGVKDAGLCHGAFGIMHIYNFMYKETGEVACKEAADFWLDKALEMAIHQEGHAGYMRWQGGENAGWKNEINLLEGVSGIGLAMISYLAPFDTKWDQCMLMG